MPVFDTLLFFIFLSPVINYYEYIPYIDSSFFEEPSFKGSWYYNEFDFENFVSGTKLKGSELGLADASSGMELSIVDDIDLKNNKVLKLSYDGSLSTGPSVKINNGLPPVKFRPRNGVSSVAEFKIKFEGNTSVNNIYINPLYNLNGIIPIIQQLPPNCSPYVC